MSTLDCPPAAFEIKGLLVGIRRFLTQALTLQRS